MYQCADQTEVTLFFVHNPPMYRLSHFFTEFLDHLKMKFQASTEMPDKREKCNDDTIRHVNCKNYWLECKYYTK